MALYRVQAVGARFWRGQPKRWNNTFHYAPVGSPDLTAMLAAIYAVLQNLGSAKFNSTLASLHLYDAVKGGTSLVSATYCPWNVPASWVQFTGTLWGGTTGQPVTGEEAALFETPMGLSKTGKPVSLKTYWHSFSGANTDQSAAGQFLSGVPQAAATQYNKLQAVSDGAGNGLVLVGPKGQPIGSTATMRNYVYTHQAVRGRRKAHAAKTSAQAQAYAQALQAAESEAYNLANG